MYSVLFVIGCVETHQFLSYIYLFRWVLRHLVWSKCTEHCSVEVKFYFCVLGRRVHQDEPVIMYPEYELSSLASGVMIELVFIVVVVFLLLLFLFSVSSFVVSLFIV
jgi:hypothetical protein